MLKICITNSKMLQIVLCKFVVEGKWPRHVNGVTRELQDAYEVKKEGRVGHYQEPI